MCSSLCMNKASGGDGIPVELFQILKDDAVKALHSICWQIWKLSSGHRTGKDQFSFQSQRMFKVLHNCTHLTHYQSNVQSSASQASTVSEPWTSRCLSWIQKRQRKQRLSCQHLLDDRKSKRVLEKHLLLLSWLCQSLWLCGSQQTVENSSKDGNNSPPDLPPEKSVCRSGSNS